MKLIPIKGGADHFLDLSNAPMFFEIVKMTFDFYKRVGFTEPWIGYFAKKNGDFVGTGGFKGKPVNGTIEIAYGTFDAFQNKGVGSEICRLLVEIAQSTDPTLKITARTLPEENFSTKILKKNRFIFSGTVQDPEDGEVWEWVYAPEAG